MLLFVFSFHHSATPETYPLSLHDALPISGLGAPDLVRSRQPDGPAQPSFAQRELRHLGMATAYVDLGRPGGAGVEARSEEHTSELQSLRHLVCRLRLEKKKTKK